MEGLKLKVRLTERKKRAKRRSQINKGDDIARDYNCRQERLLQNSGPLFPRQSVFLIIFSLLL